ncbi:uncharacterized protein HaLaN_04110 [Haematococcus lacustris]|uniref:Uncharacterized protein n=1 Tax=Haematococcus lacustris TaxID=44745 RepID=A0A699Z110_HAELA|nr:uncharacterized protein HaLaN_04110 [Haematococcus lacustris]
MRVKALEPLTMMVRGANTPQDLKAAALNALAQVCRHHDELVNQVANQGVLQSAVTALTDKMTPAIRRNAAALLLQATQKTPDLAEVVCKGGAPAALQKYMALEAGNVDGLLAGIMITALLAKAVVDSGAGLPVIEALKHSDSQVMGCSAWAVEQMAQHGEECAGPLIEAGALQHLMDMAARVPKKDLDLAAKVKASTKALFTHTAWPPNPNPNPPPTLLCRGISVTGYCQDMHDKHARTRPDGRPTSM